MISVADQLAWEAMDDKTKHAALEALIAELLEKGLAVEECPACADLEDELGTLVHAVTAAVQKIVAQRDLAEQGGLLVRAEALAFAIDVLQEIEL